MRDADIRAGARLRRGAQYGVVRHARLAPNVACWFPDEAALYLVMKRVARAGWSWRGLDRVAPEVLLTADNPARPVRDAYVDADGTIWVLSTGEPPSPAPDVPGGWVLARYGPRGELMSVRRLAEPVRLILRAGGGRALVLTGAGMVAEVTP